MDMGMDLENVKCVMVIDETLPLGIAANTAAILGICLGKVRANLVGEDVFDGTGKRHLGIIEIPVPILRGTSETIRAVRERLYEAEFADLTVADFSDVAKGCKTYETFVEKMTLVSENELRYLGIAICGEKKMINKLTGSMGVLR